MALFHSLLRATLTTPVVFAAALGASYASDAILCEKAAEKAARDTGVPLDLLHQISLAETGRTRSGTRRPWPWTLNIAGQGRWLDSETETLGVLNRLRNEGVKDFDVGCFQVNFRWHGSAFESLENMLSPTENALYAAKFLLKLYSEFGTWEKATGAYHSRDPERAEKYATRVASFTPASGTSEPSFQVPSDPTRQSFSHGVSLGSLMSTQITGAKPLFTQPSEGL
jgi:hypothetical protein